MAIKEYLLKDICYFQTGIDPLKDEINGEIPFVKLGNTNNNQIIYKYCDQITTNRKEKCNIGDLLLCWSCSIGESFIVEEECFFSTAFYKICKKNNVFLNKYLHYYFIKNKKYIYSLGVGSVLKKANMKILGNYSIKLPDLDEQQEIINIIEPFERLKNKINNIMEYLKMITLIQINNFNLPTDTSLKIFNNIQGYSFKSSDFKNKGQYKIFKISNILNNNEKNFSYTDNIVLKHLLKCGDVVTGLSGTIGTSCVIYENNMYILNQRLLAINSNIPLLIKMLIEKNKKILEQSSTGSVQKNITKNDILNIKLNSKLINKFNELISKLYILNLKISNVIDVIINNLVNLYII